MNKLTEEEFRTYLKPRHNFYYTKNDTELMLEDLGDIGVEHEIQLTAPLGEPREGIVVEVTAEFKTLADFMEAAALTTIEDLEKLGALFCSAQYTQGQGFYSCMVEELDNAVLRFRVKNEMTIVYSQDLHYYDELEEVFTIILFTPHDPA